jgi:predicted enzyme related to lactoylglutathione lyase
MEGQLVHFELPSQDNSRAKTFWSSLFGWKFHEFEGPGEYTMLDGNEPGGAIYPSQSGERGPVVYFGTDDIDKTIARVRELGGSAEDKQPIPSVGWFARCTDTEGNDFSLFQSDESVAPTG